MKKYHDPDSVLDDMPLFLEFEKDVRARGPQNVQTRMTADPDDPYTFFEKNGRLCYKSGCPFYGGYWLGRSGAVVCRQVDFLLPGIILELYCRNHCAECPLHTDEYTAIPWFIRK